MQEAFGGIKDVKVSGLEEAFVQRFRAPARIVADRQITFGVFSKVPSYAMQVLLFGGMLLALIYLMTHYGGLQQALPVLALYAFAGYRLMPNIQRIYQQVSWFQVALTASLDRVTWHEPAPSNSRSRVAMAARLNAGRLSRADVPA